MLIAKLGRDMVATIPLTEHLELGTLKCTPAQSCTHREGKQRPSSLPNPQNPKKQSPQSQAHRATFITSYQHLPAEVPLMAASPANYLHKHSLPRLALGHVVSPKAGDRLGNTGQACWAAGAG